MASSNGDGLADGAGVKTVAEADSDGSDANDDDEADSDGMEVAAGASLESNGDDDEADSDGMDVAAGADLKSDSDKSGAQDGGAIEGSVAIGDECLSKQADTLQDNSCGLPNSVLIVGKDIFGITLLLFRLETFLDTVTGNGTTAAGGGEGTIVGTAAMEVRCLPTPQSWQSLQTYLYTSSFSASARGLWSAARLHASKHAPFACHAMHRSPPLGQTGIGTAGVRPSRRFRSVAMLIVATFRPKTVLGSYR